MNDAEYIFRTDCAEKKRAGHGAQHKVRSGGRRVMMPSDHLTRKEKEKLNGECMSYDMSKPVEWAVFRSWPVDIQREFLDKLYHDYGFTQTMLGKVFGISQTTVKDTMRLLGVKPRKKGGLPTSNEVITRFNAFMEKKPDLRETKVNNAEPDQKATILQVNQNNIATILAMLAGTGARLTIEVTL